MVTEYAQIRRIQINQLYSEHTHVITSQVKDSSTSRKIPSCFFTVTWPFFLLPKTTIITFIYFFNIETDFLFYLTIITFNIVISSAYFDICVDGLT